MARTSTKTKPRRSATRRATARRKPQAKARKAARPKQRFVVSHQREEDFAEGLRRYAKYRDLGIAEATNGLDRKSTRLNSSHSSTSYAVFCLKKKKAQNSKEV